MTPREREPVAPRVRSRRRRRPVARRTLALVATGVVVSGLALGAQWLLRQPYFRVQHVTITGLRHEGRAAVLAASGLESRPSMIDLNEGALTTRLKSFAWINTVTITKHWPNSLVIAVHESLAVGVAFAAGHHLEFVSANGRELGPAPLAANLPTLEYGTSTPAAWPFLRAGRGAAYVASRLPPAFASQVARVSDDAQGDVILTLTTPVTFELGAPSDLHAKFVAIASVIAHSTLSPGDVVDVSVPDELAVSPPT